MDLVNEVFSKLDMYKSIKDDLSINNSTQLSNYLLSKVSKMDRSYLELLFNLIFEDIENKDEVIQMIAMRQTNQNINKKVYKTVIQPKFNIIPYNVKSIENILNRVYSQDYKRRGENSYRQNLIDKSSQTRNEEGVSKIAISIGQNNSLDQLKNRSKNLSITIS